MQVRRPDGTAVEDSQWRTAKTLDLLRLLALHNGEPVSVASIIDRLWPDVDESRGRASLRTAASQLRKVLGEDSIERRPTGLVLLGAWVDVQDYETLVNDVAASRRSGDHARTVALVEEAEALYVGDLDVPDGAGDWLFDAMGELRRLRSRTLLYAADAAASLCWMRDSLELAERAAALDPSEDSTRALMRALGGVGELEKALEVFDRTRRTLAKKYGVDPSPQTRALHLQLLTGTAAVTREVGLVGHSKVVEHLTFTIGSMRRSGEGGVIWLQGDPGSGRDTIVATACRAVGLSLHDLSSDPWLRERRDATSPSDVPDTDVVVMPHADRVAPHALKMVEALARQRGGVIVVPVGMAPLTPSEEPPGSVRHRVIEVEPLSEDELVELATLVLQGRPSDRLLHHLRAESGGLSGVACQVAREWLVEGRVVWSIDGLELTTGAARHLQGASVRLRRALRMMSPYAEDVVHVLAAAGVEVHADEIVRVVAAMYEGCATSDISAAVTQLFEAGVIVHGVRGYRLREHNLRAEVLAWMRPHVRRRLHELVARLITVSTSERTDRVLAAKELPGAPFGAVASA